MEYDTTDIILAAYLVLLNQKMVRIIKAGMQGTFVFDSPDLELIRLYDMGRAQVEPVAFNREVKRLTTAVKRLT